MKAIAFYISTAFLGASLLLGCDTIDNPYPKTFDQLSAKEGLELDSIEVTKGSGQVVQKVLLEDYTGHTCGNCPGAALMAKDQKKQHGDRLVVVAVHAGYFAKFNKAPYTTNFTTPEGEEWATSFGVISNPNGMVNRTKGGTSNSVVLGVSNWPASIATQLNEAPQVDMTLTTVNKPETRKVNIKVRSKYLADLPGKYNLMVVITEDSIVNWQKNYGQAAGGDPAYPVGDVNNYMHPHAMRSVLTGTWGKTNKAAPKAGEVTEAYFSATLDPAWNASKCSVVAFIVDEASREVIQVEEVHLK